MSNGLKSLNDVAWEKLFLKYKILEAVETKGQFKISATQIKEFREPRLMAKFDHKINLPQVFAENELAILPITRGDYLISHFDAYHSFEEESATVTKVTLPSYIQSLDYNNIPSEAISLNCAMATGMLAHFLQDEDLIATVSGRMGSGAFDFSIANSKSKKQCMVEVKNSQVEIDAAYEGVHSLALFEAKRDLSEDFLVRQLYYPFRLWQNNITKKVRPVFLVYSNGIYRLYEYMFQDPNNYSSLVLVQQKNYSIEETSITIEDIQNTLCNVKLKPEPNIPFPQADSFERVINICELLSDQALSRVEVTEQYAFDARQTNYYTDAARYLGLLEKSNDSRTPFYQLSAQGRKNLGLNYKQRQLSYCNCILSHKTFYETFKKCLSCGEMPAKAEIIQIMKESGLYEVRSETTFERRSSTIRGWLNWILGLVNE